MSLPKIIAALTVLPFAVTLLFSQEAERRAAGSPACSAGARDFTPRRLPEHALERSALAVAQRSYASTVNDAILLADNMLFVRWLSVQPVSDVVFKAAHPSNAAFPDRGVLCGARADMLAPEFRGVHVDPSDPIQPISARHIHDRVSGAARFGCGRDTLVWLGGDGDNACKAIVTLLRSLESRVDVVKDKIAFLVAAADSAALRGIAPSPDVGFAVTISQSTGPIVSLFPHEPARMRAHELAHVTAARARRSSMNERHDRDLEEAFARGVDGSFRERLRSEVTEAGVPASEWIGAHAAKVSSGQTDIPSVSSRFSRVPLRVDLFAALFRRALDSCSRFPVEFLARRWQGKEAELALRMSRFLGLEVQDVLNAEIVLESAPFDTRRSRTRTCVE